MSLQQSLQKVFSPTSFKLLWFLHHHGGAFPDHVPWTPEEKSFCDKLLEPEAPLATLLLQWAGQNLLGWPTRSEKLVSWHELSLVRKHAMLLLRPCRLALCETSVGLMLLLQGTSTLNGVHAVLQSLYDQQVIRHGGRVAGQWLLVMLFDQ